MNNDRRARLAPVFNRYAAECRSRAETLAAILADAPAEPDLQAVVLHAHTLAGSGATMGAEALSVEARRLEELAKTLQDEERRPGADERQVMAALAASLLAAASGFDAEAMLDAFIVKMFPNG
ncbi:MAG TPA: Hpt domain-containing protein [Candidatus Sulfotelmatobacter sp.]|nr:Hpt domain-containing protein [Candidatus Sulfotelmatobacter sp.]